MRKIVFEFMRADRLRGDSQPEKVFIAIKAIFGIHDFIKDQTPTEIESHSTPKYDTTEYMPSICVVPSINSILGYYFFKVVYRFIFLLCIFSVTKINNFISWT